MMLPIAWDLGSTVVAIRASAISPSTYTSMDGYFLIVFGHSVGHEEEHPEVG